MRKPLPVGVEFVEEFNNKGYYYIDKTLFIKELIDNMGKVNLFTRPRRFGKTLTLDMLRCFFEEGSDPALFEGICQILIHTKYIFISCNCIHCSFGINHKHYERITRKCSCICY